MTQGHEALPAHGVKGLARTAWAWAAALGACLALTGCGGAEQPTREVEARKQTPISVCTTQLAPVAGGRGKNLVRSLDPEQWIQVMIPSFEDEKGLSPTDIDCTSHYAFANEMLRGGISARGWPRLVDPDDLDVRAGPDGMRVLWLRTLTFENGDEGGPIALVRAANDRAEVYGIGSYRGPAKTKLTPVRLGNDNVVVAETKTCSSSNDCQHKAHFYLPRRGRLIEAGVVDLERIAVVPSVTARGLYARYHLRTDVSYKPDGIYLLEQIAVKIVHYEDGKRDSDRDLRKVEFARMLRVERDALFPTNDSLWERVVGQD
jgi:hypothetical protein